MLQFCIKYLNYSTIFAQSSLDDGWRKPCINRGWNVRLIAGLTVGHILFMWLVFTPKAKNISLIRRGTLLLWAVTEQFPGETVDKIIASPGYGYALNFLSTPRWIKVLLTFNPWKPDCCQPSGSVSGMKCRPTHVFTGTLIGEKSVWRPHDIGLQKD